jgi:hypothetical protein
MYESKLGYEVDKFLNAISSTEDNEKSRLGSSAKSYKPGFDWFSKFLTEQSLKEDSQFKKVKTIPDFFVAVRIDNKIDVAERKKFPDRELLKGFGSYLEKKDYAPKTVRAYATSIQTLFKYFKIEITMVYSKLPPAAVQNPKKEWNLQEVGDFIQSFDSKLYRCLGVWFLESGLSNVDLLGLTYGKVRAQYENDINPFCFNLCRQKTAQYQIKFRSFIGTQGIKYFREYYESLDEALSDDDLIFDISSVSIQKYFERRSKRFFPKVQSKADSAKKEPIKKLRNLCVPSSLRTAFRTFLTDKIGDNTIEYMMGHDLGDLGKTYVNRSDDSWRAFYKKDCERFLTFKETKIA